jgi:hypothetical protein
MVSPVFLYTDLWNFPFMVEKEFYCEVTLLPQTRRFYTALTNSLHYLLVSMIKEPSFLHH